MLASLVGLNALSSVAVSRSDDADFEILGGANSVLFIIRASSHLGPESRARPPSPLRKFEKETKNKNMMRRKGGGSLGPTTPAQCFQNDIDTSTHLPAGPAWLRMELIVVVNVVEQTGV